MKNRQTIWSGCVILLIMVMGFAAYGNTFKGPFLFDDYWHILQNGHIRIQELSPSSLYDAAFRNPISTRPVAYITFALNYYFHGFWEPGYHLINIFIHCLTGVFLFLFLQITMSTPALRKSYPSDAGRLISALSTLLWLLHPLNTQSVSYIVQRMNSLSAMFFILSMLLYLKAKTGHGGYRRLNVAGCVISGLVAMGAKEIAATLPLIIFVYEWYFFQDLNRTWFKKKLPWLAAAVVIVFFIAGVYLDWNFASILTGYRTREFTLKQRLLTEPRVIWHYISLIACPWPGWLSLEYDFTISTSLTQPPTTLIAIIAMSLLMATAVFTAPRHRLFSFSILWFLFNLLIESSFIALEIIFEHRTYLPAMLVWPPLLDLLFKLTLSRRKLAVIGVSIVILIFGLGTFQRNQIWSDAIALNRDIVRKVPNRARARSNLGWALLASNREEYEQEALLEIERAIQLDPAYPFSYLNLGGYFMRKERYAEAVDNFQKFKRLQPLHPSTNFSLGQAYFKNKQFPEAIAALQEVVDNKAFREQALLSLGIASSETGDLATSIDSFQKLNQFKPNSGRYRFNLGHALEQAGRKDQALQHYEKALGLAADNDKQIIQQSIDHLLSTYSNPKP